MINLFVAVTMSSERDRERTRRSVSRIRGRGRVRERERDGRDERKAPNVDALFTLKVDNISFRTTADILR